MPRASSRQPKSNVWQDPDARRALADPAVSLQMYGYVLNQADGTEVLWSPTAITGAAERYIGNMQSTIVAYMSRPPVDENGYTLWLSVLAGRQTGKSVTGEAAMYPIAAYTPGYDCVTIADTEKRANYLHDRVQFLHHRWPQELRTPQLASNERRQLTFVHGAKMRVLSAESGAVGIGQSVDILKGSELAYWTDASRQFSLIYPSMMNRKHARMLLECTPAPLSEPSAQWWKDKCEDGRQRKGRNIYAFFPFWDSKLNRRPWDERSEPTLEELRLLDRYGSRGLDYENLAFRREVIDTDGEIRRNPELFGVYYPFDDVTCWISSSGSIIRSSLLERHRQYGLTDWSGPYGEIEPPEPGALYAIGVDPAGYSGRDHAAFVVLKCWAGDWKEVAAFSDHCDPPQLADLLHKTAVRYNNALVGIERNGVGVAVIALMQDKYKYPRLYYDENFKPGVHKVSHEQMVSVLIDSLLDELRSISKTTYSQLISYQADRVIEQTLKSELISGLARGRRERHHWDRVSALMVACITARALPRRYRNEPRRGIIPENVIPFNEMSWHQLEEYAARVAARRAPRQNGRARYTSIRSRRRK